MSGRREELKDVQIRPVRMGGPNRFGGGHRFMPGEKAKDSKGTFRKLIRFYLSEGRAMIIVAFLIFIQTGIGIFAPFMIGRAVDAMIVPVDFDIALSFIFILVIIYIAGWGIDITQGVVMNFTSQRIVRKIRKTLFDKYQTLPLSYHDSHSYGELMSRMTNDVDNISQTIAQSTITFISAVISLCGSLIIMLYLNIWMTFAALTIIPLVYLLTLITAKRSRKNFGI